MAKVIIRDNGAYSADWVEVEFEDGGVRAYNWHEMNPSNLQIILEDLGHEVERVDHKYPHDED